MRQLYLTAMALLVAGAFAACSSDEDAIQEQPAPEAGPVTIRATITDEPASRIALGESTGTSTKVLWTNGDAFSLKVGETACTFTTALTAPSATANFTCESAPALAEGTTVTATYPATLPTSYAEQPGTAEGLSRYLTLTATATATTDSYDDLALSFKHNTSVVKLTLTNDAFKSAQVTDITLATAGWSVKATSSFTGSENGNVTAYLVINSTDELTEATITATCGGASYGAALGGKTLTAGKLYKVTKTMTKQPEAYALSYSSAVLTGLNEAIASNSLTKVKFVAGSLKTAETDAYTDPYGSSVYIVTNGEWLEVHTYAKTFQVNPENLFYTSNHSNFAQLTEIDFNNSVTLSGTSMLGMFYGCSALTSITFGESFNTAAVTLMYGMFQGCSSLTSINLSSFNTAAVTHMGDMFYGCSSLQSITFSSSFNTEKVTNMDMMFYNCSSLTSLDLSGFNTVAVTNMNRMFESCSSLAELDLSGFNTAAVTDMGSMFESCSSLTSLDLSSFNTAAVTDMSFMFYGCKALTSLDLSSFTFAATSYSMMFSDVGYNSFMNNNYTSVAKIYVSEAGKKALDAAAATTNLDLFFATLVEKTE